MKPTLSYDEFNVAMLVLRLAIGPIVAYHGYAKISQGGGLAGAAQWFDNLGMRPGRVHAQLTAYGELAAGTLITLGFLASIAGLILVELTVVAYFTVHRGKGLLMARGGWEYDLVLAAAGVGIAMLGAARYSLDHAFGIDLNGNIGLAISLLGGMAVAIALLSAAYHPPVEDAS
jgi:putative oxidoreductase